MSLLAVAEQTLSDIDAAAVASNLVRTDEPARRADPPATALRYAWAAR